MLCHFIHHISHQVLDIYLINLCLLLIKLLIHLCNGFLDLWINRLLDSLIKVSKFFLKILCDLSDVLFDLRLKDCIKTIQTFVDLSQDRVVATSPLSYLFVNKGSCKGLKRLKLLLDVFIEQLLV